MANVPASIDKYKVVRRLGRGGAGTVYLARDPRLDRLIAIKVLHDPLFDDDSLQRFFQEARAAANLRHENIITVHDIGHADHQPFMAMEYMDGVTLAELIRSRPLLPLATKLQLLERICAGLAFAHTQKVIHRDVKPANVMVDRRETIRVLDFGIARVEGSRLTLDGAMLGTLNYMAPEQMLGMPVDHRTDIFAVGAVAYELLTYQAAFPGTINDGLLHRLPNEAPAPLIDLVPELPSALVPVVMRALEKSPQRRYSNLDEMAAALRAIRDDLDVTFLPTLRVRRPLLPVAQGNLSALPSAAEAPASQLVATHLAEAQAAFERRDWASAAAGCEAALALDPQHTDAHQLLDEVRRIAETDPGQASAVESPQLPP